MTDGTDIGHGVRVNFYSYDQHERAGLQDTHPNPTTGEDCVGAVMFDLPGVKEAFPDTPRWTVESWDPLTLSPSMLCRVCGHHGFIRDGKWVPA